ncbi:alpha-mannosyltransferase [Amycolatopsis antarctica]|uniref:Alpha-mannosyltransferase n=1 Tax=Amycolatopsis antarctica TaxID=1854586 RepID=A0A263DCM1_9PSEU|nr:alpha-mannosyltransferase [Amycolatopsis antarctica]
MNGVTNSVLRVVEYLRERGHRVLVVAPGPGPTEYAGVAVVRLPSVELPVVTSLRIGVPTRTVRTALTAFAPDVVHLASPFVVGARGLAAARRLGVPTIAVYQTDIAGFAAAYGLRLGAGTAWRWTRGLHSRADRTLAPSTAAVDELREHGVPRVHRWGRGVDTECFSPEHADPRLRARLAPAGELLVGFVGRLAPEKQVDRLAALANVEGVRLVVAGDGPDLGALRQRLPGATFLGARHGGELAAVYACLDVFVHTGPYETFCQTVQEAMASGVPVLAPDAGGPRDLVRHGHTGYLLPADRPGFAAELPGYVERLRDGAVRARLGAEARSTVLGRTWAAVCAELLGHYEAVTGRVTRAA